MTLDGKILLSCSSDKTIKIWRLPDGKLLQNLVGLPPIAFSPNGETLITAAPGNLLKIWQQTPLTNTEDILQSQPWSDIFAVAPDADFATVKAAYRALVKQYHPDLNPSPAAHSKMPAINQAFEPSYFSSTSLDA